VIIPSGRPCKKDELHTWVKNHGPYELNEFEKLYAGEAFSLLIRNELGFKVTCEVTASEDCEILRPGIFFVSQMEINGTVNDVQYDAKRHSYQRVQRLLYQSAFPKLASEGEYLVYLVMGC